MGLISASSLGQPIIRVNISTSKRSVVSSSLNVLPRGRSPLKTAATMAPALTTESSAEHRKRSLSSELCSVVNKLDPSSGDRRAAAEPAGPSKGPSPPPPTQTQLTNSDEEAAALKAADEVLGPNVDEILQVLESIESSDKCGGGSTSAEDSMLQRLLGSADLDLLAGAICGSQEQDADVAEVVTSPVPSPTPKVEERVAETSERQHVLERRCERLLRRVRKMQARGTSRHAAHQMQDLVTSARALLKARNASHRSHAASQQKATKEQLLDTENVKNMSATALVNLVRKMSSSPGKSASQGLAQALSPDQASNLRAGASSLSLRLHHTEAVLDSDVTASSSGGESCDEAVGYNSNHTGTLPICKRAAWRFAKERASVVSRWTWLQANIADLEYRIRQYTECHRSIRLNKGAVRLELPVAPAKPPQGEESMVVNGCHMEPPVPLEEQACARTRPLDTSTYRRRKIVAPGVLKPIYDQKAENAVIRTLPTHNQPPCCRDNQSLAMPCILCFKKRSGGVSASGSGPPPPPRDPIARESCKERVARLDPALHPVMSGLSDVSRALHMAAHLRQSSWQQSQLRHRGLAKLGLGLKRSKAAANAGQLGQGTVELLTSPSQQTPRRKYNVHKKNNNSASSTALSAKIRRKAKNRKRHRGRPAAADGPDAFVERYRRNSRKLQRLSSEGMPNLTAEGDVADRPIPAPSPSVVSESRAPRRKREDSYDIDNIVIPYSMAALTRVERLEYKEILTPKWRMVDAELAKASSLASAKSGLGKNGVVKPSNSTPPSPDSEVEDISDEAVTARHDALEMEERRKFRCPPSTRGLRGRRTDSRAESSGANTPDPMSPNPVAAEVGDSPMASPRATPLPPAMLQEDSQGSKPGGSKPLASGSKQPSIGLRRRTVSSQRASPEPSTPFYEIAPFEARMFPLQEDIFQRMLAGSDHPPSMPTLAPVLSPESCTDRRRSSIQESSTRTPRTLPSPPPSPCDTDSTESALPEDDDMDPEWTLDSEMVPSPQSASSSSAVRPFRRSQ